LRSGGWISRDLNRSGDEIRPVVEVQSLHCKNFNPFLPSTQNVIEDESQKESSMEEVREEERSMGGAPCPICKKQAASVLYIHADRGETTGHLGSCADCWEEIKKKRDPRDELWCPSSFSKVSKEVTVFKS